MECNLSSVDKYFIILYDLFVSTGDIYDQVIFAEKGQEPRKYDVMSGDGKWKEYLKGKFPKEKDNIER